MNTLFRFGLLTWLTLPLVAQDFGIVFGRIGDSEDEFPDEIWRQNGLFDFERDQVWPVALPTAAILFEDFNNDGDNDLFLALDTDKNRVYISNGRSGYLDKSQDFPTDDESLWLASGDIDTNGSTDVVVVNRDGQATIYFNDGTGGFEASDQNLTVGAGQPHLADMDGDRDLDLVVGSSVGGIWPNDGSGVFDNRNINPSLRNAALAIGDSNGDQLPEIFTGSGSTISLYINQKRLQFRKTTVAIHIPNPVALALADLDGDGDSDLTVASQGNCNAPVSLFLNMDNASFRHIEAPLYLFQAQDMLVKDMNHDGLADILVGSRLPGETRLWWNRGNLRFSDSGQFRELPGIRSLAVAPLPSSCQAYRWVPHITHPEGSFQTEIILRNTTNHPQSLEIVPRQADGSVNASISMDLQPEALLTLDAADFFDDPAVSHFSICGSLDVPVTLSFQNRNSGAKAYLSETREGSLSFSLFPGDWNRFFDAAAFINPNDRVSSLNVSLLDDQGQVLTSRPLSNGLRPGAKTTVVFNDLFQDARGSELQITASRPVIAVFLRGTLGSGDVLFAQSVLQKEF